MKSNKSTHHPFYIHSTWTLFAVYQVHSWEVKVTTQFKTQEEVGSEDLCCFVIYDRNVLIPTDSMAILFKPKLTHFCPSGSESLSCLKVRHSWAHPSSATTKRDTCSLFANSPVRNDHCLSPSALTILSQHFLSTGFMRCKVMKTATGAHWMAGDPTRRPQNAAPSTFKQLDLELMGMALQLTARGIYLSSR